MREVQAGILEFELPCCPSENRALPRLEAAIWVRTCHIEGENTAAAAAGKRLGWRMVRYRPGAQRSNAVEEPLEEASTPLLAVSAPDMMKAEAADSRGPAANSRSGQELGAVQPRW
jgi:hypothetical protein